MLTAHKTPPKRAAAGSDGLPSRPRTRHVHSTPPASEIAMWVAAPATRRLEDEVRRELPGMRWAID